MATGTADVAIMISGELNKLEEAEAASDNRRGASTTNTLYPGVVGIDPSARMLEVSSSSARRTLERTEIAKGTRLGFW